MKKQLSSGCSIETVNTMWAPVTSQHIARKLRLRYENVALGGAGNFYILQSVINKVLTDKDIDFVTVGWSYYSRLDLFDDLGTPYVTNLDYKFIIEKTATPTERTDYLQMIHHSQTYQTLFFVYLLQNFLSQRNINYCMWWTISPNQKIENNHKVMELYEHLDKKRFYKLEESIMHHNPSVSIHDFASDKGLQVNPPNDLHPTASAHAEWSNLILDFIQQNKLYASS